MEELGVGELLPSKKSFFLYDVGVFETVSLAVVFAHRKESQNH